MTITHRYRCTPVLYCTLAAILVVSALGSGGATAQSIVTEIIDTAACDRMPDGLSASEWSSIRAAYEANRHTASAVEGGYQARNPGQSWRTNFDGRGFLTTPDAGGWSWGLELVSHGREGAERAVASPTCVEAEGKRVSYQWSESLTEWYVNDQRGLEHGYTVHERPEGIIGETPVPHFQITLAVRGGLVPRVGSNGRDVTFVDANGGGVVNYTGLSVFDADGASVPARFEACFRLGALPARSLERGDPRFGCRRPTRDLQASPSNSNNADTNSHTAQTTAVLQACTVAIHQCNTETGHSRCHRRLRKYFCRFRQ